MVIAESSNLDHGDRRVVLIANWVIYGAFATNFTVRLLVAPDRRTALQQLRWDLLIVIGQPLLAIVEAGAAGLAPLVRLVAVVVRTLSRGGVLKRAWRTVTERPLRLLVAAVPFMLLLCSSFVLKAERSWGKDGSVRSIGQALWWGAATMATVGYGDIAPRSPLGRVAAVLTMVVGIGAFSVLTAKMAELLFVSRDSTARSDVDVNNHTLLLGWSAKVATIVDELVVANESEPCADVVVLAGRSKFEVQRELESRVPHLVRATTTLTCRTGSPRDPTDLARVHPERARAIVVANDATNTSDTVMSLLALLTGATPPRPGVPVIAELSDASAANAVRLAFGDRVLVIEPNTLIARLTAQSCRQPGLGIAYEELLDFRGSEMYIATVPGAVGLTFGELLNAFDDASPLGVVGTGGCVELVPTMTRPIEESDRLIMLATDDRAIAFSGVRAVEPAAAAEADGHPAELKEHVVVVGWNELGVRLVAELDNYLALGSTITVVVDCDHCLPPIAPSGGRAAVRVESTTGADYPARVDAVIAGGCDHVVVLAERRLSAADSDARALLASLQAQQGGRYISLVTELRDERNAALARQASAGDFIVSDRLASLLMAQLAESPELSSVFDQLLDPAGPELYSRPAAWYAPVGAAVSFEAIVERARQRNEVAIGYLLRQGVRDVGHSFGAVVNPPKRTQVVLAGEDRIFVLADPSRVV